MCPRVISVEGLTNAQEDLKMTYKNTMRAAIALLIGSLTSITQASAFVPIPTPRSAIVNQLAATPVEFVIGFSVNNGERFYNGHRGYRSHRNGYRFYNGFWFPNSAFVIGRSQPRNYDRPRYIRLSAAHVRWCENRYRTYRVYDNSFQPNYGNRRACNSPFR